MRRILVFGMTENPGGIESFLITYYRNINREQLQFDFLCNFYEKAAYEDELITLGARVFHITPRRESREKFKRELNKLFEEHVMEWDAIWVNVCSLANIDYLKVAKKYGLKRRIIHSHNSENMDSFARGMLHKVNRIIISKYVTDYWACSESAAKWFYKKKYLKKVVLIHNAIDVKKFKFDINNRKKIRKEIDATEREAIIGNIGRLHFQKNQKFAIDIFHEYLKIHADSRLILIGQGEDENILKEKCDSLGIREKVVFTGVQNNVEEWLSAFDLFLFPSVFEGLSIVALEAQANGVPVLASEQVIPKEVRICDNFNFFSLDKSARDWSKKIDDVKDTGRIDSSSILKAFRLKGYDIEEESGRLEQLFR